MNIIIKIRAVISKNSTLYFSLAFYIPKIIFRSITFAIKGKKVSLQSFKVNSNYCIHGTLNQLTWIAENAIFIILENSSKIFFGPNEQIFKVNENENTFKLICFGFGGKKIAITSIKVVKISMTDFEPVNIKNGNHSIRIQQPSLDKPFHSIKEKSPFSNLKFHQINEVNLKPKFKEIKCPLPRLEKIKAYNSLADLQILKRIN